MNSLCLREKLSDDRCCKEGEEAREGRAWWRAHDECVFVHFQRHLALSERSLELRSLLRDIRWTIRRIEVGVIVIECDFWVSA